MDRDTRYLSQRPVHPATYDHRGIRSTALWHNLTPFDQGYVDLLARYTTPLVQLGTPASQLNTTATGLVYQQLRSQAAILGNSDVFLMCAALAFLAVPLAFLLSRGKGKGGEGAG